MKNFANARVQGIPEVCLYGPDGKLKQRVIAKNRVVDTGLAYFISRAVGTAKAVMSHMAIGSGSTAPAAGNTQLGTQIGGRVAFDSVTITGSEDEKVVYVATFDSSHPPGAVTEAGIFNAASGGDMLCRVTFPVVNKQADDQMVITWTVEQKAEV